MRETVPKSGLFDSFSEEMYQSMFDQEIANVVTKQKGIGLSDALYRDFIKKEQMAPIPGSDNRLQKSNFFNPQGE